MTQTPEPRPSGAQNIMGFVVFFVGVGAMAWMKLDGTITWPGIALSFLVSGAGTWIVAAPRLAGYVQTVEHVAETVQRVRGGQMNVSPPPDTSTVVNRPEGATVVVPPQAEPVVLDDAPARRASPIPTPTAGAPRRRGRRATDAIVAPPAPVPVTPTDVTQPIAIPRAAADDDEGIL